MLARNQYPNSNLCIRGNEAIGNTSKPGLVADTYGWRRSPDMRDGRVSNCAQHRLKKTLFTLSGEAAVIAANARQQTYSVAQNCNRGR